MTTTFVHGNNVLRFATTGDSRAACDRRAEEVARGYFGPNARLQINCGDATVSEYDALRTSVGNVVIEHVTYSTDYVVVRSEP